MKIEVGKGNNGMNYEATGYLSQSRIATPSQV